MARDWLQFRLWSQGERLALPPGVFDRGQYPEVALGIPHDPLLRGPLDKEGHQTFCSASHVLLLWSMVAQGTRHLDLPLSPVVPGRSAAYGDAANASVPVCPPSRPYRILLIRGTKAPSQRPCRSPAGRWWPGQASTDALGEIRRIARRL